MIEEFWNWFKDAVNSIVDAFWNAFWDALGVAWWTFMAVITSPVWIIPFLYWYFRKWKKVKEPET